MNAVNPSTGNQSLPLLFALEGVNGARISIARPVLEYATEFAEAVNESRQDLNPWFSYARKELQAPIARELCRAAQQQFDWIATNTRSVTRRHELTYFITGRLSQRFIGIFVLRNIALSEGSIELGYWIRTSMHRMGYATEAIDAMRSLIRRTGCFRTMVLQISPRNAGSIALADRLGFQLGRSASHGEDVNEYHALP